MPSLDGAIIGDLIERIGRITTIRTRNRGSG